MKTNDEKTLQEKTLRVLARTWALGRVLLEHAKAGAAPVDQHELNERDELIVKLTELFPEEVTETTLTKVFNLHYSQAGQIVDRLCRCDILQKKTGRGAPLKLTKTGEQVAKEIELKRGYRFSYICDIFTDEELLQLTKMMEKMCDAAHQQIEARVFDKLPRNVRQLGKTV
ncbi:MAG: hypothetical protein ABSH38_23595 [Verrucomicrobiota bacterium]